LIDSITAKTGSDHVQNVDVLKDPDVVKQLGNILKTNVRACKSLGHPYVLQVCLTFLLLFSHNTHAHALATVFQWPFSHRQG